MALYKTGVTCVSYYGRLVKFKQYDDFEYDLYKPKKRSKPNKTDVVDLEKQNVSIENEKNTDNNVEDNYFDHVTHNIESRFGRNIKLKCWVCMTTNSQPSGKRKHASDLTDQASIHIKKKLTIKHKPSSEETTSSHTTTNDYVSIASTSEKQSDIGKENNCNTSVNISKLNIEHMTSGKETTSIHTTSYDQLSNSSTSDRQSDVGEENNCNTSESDFQISGDSDDSDLEITEVFELSPRAFCPVDSLWQQKMCKKFNLNLHFPFNTLLSRPLTNPKAFRRIKGDGNCFYRCVSYWITGSEDYYAIIRAKIVEFFEKNENLIRSFSEKENVEQYLQRRKIRNNSVWATEEDIFAAAALLNTFIYVYCSYEKKWNLFKKDSSLEPPSPNERCIYIKNVPNKHYEVVINVE